MLESKKTTTTIQLQISPIGSILQVRDDVVSYK
jgi:hypothetical protein